MCVRRPFCYVNFLFLYMEISAKNDGDDEYYEESIVTTRPFSLPCKCLQGSEHGRVVTIDEESDENDMEYIKNILPSVIEKLKECEGRESRVK